MLPPTENLYGEILGAGAIVGSYIVDAHVSEGGFAVIYRAHHLQTQEPVALKVLRDRLAASDRMLERFRQEADAIRRIRHRNIVEVHEIDEMLPDRPYIAIEWLDGRDLAGELAARGPFTGAEALALMSEVCDALAAAHRVGVIHRDIKASNIIAVPDGDWFTPKLIDFGIAKLVAPADQHSSLTTRTMLGTPRTMAPEQILGQVIDARTDVYALGLLLYQLLCGRLPFDSDDPVELEQLHLQAAPPPASETAPVSPGVEAVIARALEKQPEARYPGVLEFVADLRRALTRGEDTTSSLGSRDERDSRSTPGLGVLIEVRPATRSVGHEDQVLDQTDDVLERADDLAAAMGLTIALTTSISLIAVTPLPGDADGHVAERTRLVRRISSWHREQLAAIRDGLITLHVAIHVADMTVERHASGARPIAGALLELGQWPPCGQKPGITASPAVLAGLQEHRDLAALLRDRPALVNHRDAENANTENADAENPDAENPDAENADAENPVSEDVDR